MNLTEEQKNIVNLVLSDTSDGKIIAVNSIAGAGKTSTAKAVVDAYKPDSGLYTAFNKSIVEESKKKIKGINVNTLHSFAYKYSINKNIQSLTYKSFTEKIDYSKKKMVIDILDKFYLSSYLTIDDYLNNSEEYNSDLIDKAIYILVKKYYSKMLECEIPATYNFMLKYLHLLLYEDKTNIHFDLLILDECQDTTAVALEIFKLIKATKKIILGDTHQNIYGFMDTINAFDLIENTIPMTLSKSFRCSELIANNVQKFCKHNFRSNFIYTGNPDVKNNDYEIETEVYLSRTNLGLISTMIDFHNRDVNYRLTRPIDSIFEFIISLNEASLSQRVTARKFSYLELSPIRTQSANPRPAVISISSIFENDSKNMQKTYQKTYFEKILELFPNDSEIKAGVKFLKALNELKIDLFEVKAMAEIMVDDNSPYTLSTAHTFKGLEADLVVINQDLKESYYSTGDTIDNLFYNYKTNFTAIVDREISNAKKDKSISRYLNIKDYSDTDIEKLGKYYTFKLVKKIIDSKIPLIRRLETSLNDAYSYFNNNCENEYQEIIDYLNNFIDLDLVYDIFLNQIKVFNGELNLYYVAISRAKHEIKF